MNWNEKVFIFPKDLQERDQVLCLAQRDAWFQALEISLFGKIFNFKKKLKSI